MSGIADRLAGLGLPKLTREAAIDVYLVHNSSDAEDYFFLFDFEEFADRSKAGLFVRPVIRIHGGRDDFSRVVFARQFRDVFAAEFDRMRAALAESKGRRGWLDLRLGVTAVDLVGNVVANLVLAIAFSAGRAIFGKIALPRALRGRTAEAKLANEIERTKGQVEDALKRIEVRLHPELYAHAFPEGDGRVSGVDRDAWPLPDYVRAHLRDGTNGSWW